MPDITMCDGKDCPVCDDCYRFTAKPSDLQSYMQAPWDFDKEECKYYLEV